MPSLSLIQRYFRNRSFASSLVLTLLLLSGGAALVWRGALASLAPLPPMLEAENGEEREGDLEAREDWFMFQRLYPFNTLPANARLRAWQARPTQAPDAVNAVWNALGPAPTNSAFPNNWGVTSGRINSIAVAPNDPNLILIAAATGGIWRSTNGGVNFAPVTDNQVDLAVGSIAFAPSNPNIVYAGLGDVQNSYLGTGVLKSTDAGATWARVNNDTLPARGQASRLRVSPTDANRVYLAQWTRQSGASNFSSGFYYSTDGGVSWTRTLAGLARDLVIHPTDGNTLYLAMQRTDQDSLPAGVFRSVNGGASWTLLYTSPYNANQTSNVKVAVTPANPQALYVYIGGTSGATFGTRVEVSTNGGASFTNRGNAGLDTGQFSYNCYINVSPTDANTVYVGTRDVFKSTDGAVSFTNLTNAFNAAGGYTPNSSKAHPDQHSFAFSPGDANTVYIGNDGGLYRSTNAGATFGSLNASLALTQFIGVTMHPTDAVLTYGGAQDNGAQKRLTANQPGAYKEFFGGDGGRIVVNPLTPSMIFTTYVYGSIYRWTNNGDSFSATIASNTTFGEPTSGPRIAFYPPFTGNGVDAKLYFGTWRLFTSSDLGASWTAPAGTLDLTAGSPDVLSAIGVARSNPNVIYTGSRQGRANVSLDGGVNWTNISAGLPARSITSISVHPTNPAQAYLTVSGYTTGHVFLTTNSGATWTDISGNLPDIPTSALLLDPLDANTVYVGTDIGVFRSTQGGTVWNGFNNGLPPTVVTAFSAQASGRIQLSTYGRGAYELNRTGGCATVTLSPPTLPSGSAGQTYNQLLTADGGVAPYVYTVSAGALPGGLTLTTGGTLSGTLNASGTFNFTVTATDANGCPGTRSYTVLINPNGCGALTINPASAASGFVGTAYSQLFTASGGTGALTWSLDAGALPNGLTLGTSTGLLSGLPNAIGVFSFTLKATDANNCAGLRAFTLVISGNGLQYFPLPKPIRLFDTRAPIPGFPACAALNQPIAAGGELTRSAYLTCDGVTIPPTAQAIVGNGTVTGTTGFGFVTLYPNGQARPAVATLNYGPGETVQNAFTVGLDAAGQFKVYSFAGADFIVDVTGYFAPPTTGGLYYHPLPKPLRLFDTRAAIPGFPACASLNQPLAADSEILRAARISCDGVTIPSDALAIVGNGTATSTAGFGFVTLYPNGQARPPVATLNYGPGQTIQNAFTVGLDAAGQFKVYSFAGTHFIVDVMGYYSASAFDANGVGLLYAPLSKPIRLFDTRATIPGFPACEFLNQPLVADTELVKQARISCDGVTIPTSAAAVVGNATATSTASFGFITLYPNGQTRPPVATLNYSAGQTVSNAFTVGLGADGQFRIYSFAGTHFITDVTGYYAP